MRSPQVRDFYLVVCAAERKMNIFGHHFDTAHVRAGTIRKICRTQLKQAIKRFVFLLVLASPGRGRSGRKYPQSRAPPRADMLAARRHSYASTCGRSQVIESRFSVPVSMARWRHSFGAEKQVHFRFHLSTWAIKTMERRRAQARSLWKTGGRALLLNGEGNAKGCTCAIARASHTKESKSAEGATKENLSTIALSKIQSALNKAVDRIFPPP